MIRRAKEADFIRPITTESDVRIDALKRAYGLDVPFIQYFADDEGTIASIMDGFCVVSSAQALNEEWIAFLLMHADIRTIHADEAMVAVIASAIGTSFNKGVVMRLLNVLSESTLHKFGPNEVSLRALYALLDDVFDEFSPFEGWYVDVSHRVRHGCCRMVTESVQGRLIGSAMTIAETDTAALIGGVATLLEYRRRGVATRCITQLLNSLPQKTIFIAPSDERSARLYQKLGFVPDGIWAELTLP